MSTYRIIKGVLCVSFLLVLIIPLRAQDFRQVYNIPHGGKISITNISGDVKISGTTGSVILVEAYKTGRDRDKLHVSDRSQGDTIDLKVEYPQEGNVDASINFDVKVPSSISYVFEKITSISGNLIVADVRGQMKLGAVSGNVLLQNVSGTVSASSVSGDVEVSIARAEGRGEMKFSAVSGDVDVKAPASLDADIEMSTLSGSLKTDFPIQVQERRYGPGKSARGRLGSGANSIKINSVSGRVTLTRSGS